MNTQKCIATLLTLAIVLASLPYAPVSHATRTPASGGYQFENASASDIYDGSDFSCYPDPCYPYNYQYTYSSGATMGTGIWCSPQITLDIENISSSVCNFNCYSYSNFGTISSAIKYADYDTYNKTVTGDGDYFKDISGTSFHLDFTSLPDNLSLAQIEVTAKRYICNGATTQYLSDEETATLKSAIQNRSTYTYDAGSDIYVTSLQISITNALKDANIIHFDACGGNLSTSYCIVNYDSTYKSLPTPTRTGYLFAGWYTSTSGGSRITTSSVNTSHKDMTLYAHWTPVSYSISFNGNGATSGTMENQICAYGKTYSLPKNTFAKSHTLTLYPQNTHNIETIDVPSIFNGWATSSNGSVRYANQSAVTNLSSTNNSTFPLYAVWKAGTVTLPTPIREGYTFTGWYTASQNGTYIGKGGTSISLSKNQTLYGHWTANTYTVTCIDKSNTGKELGCTSWKSSYNSVVYGSDAGEESAPHKYYEGYEYSHCTQDTVSISGCTVYRYFTPVTIEISLDTTGGILADADSSIITATYDSTYPTLATPIREGYTFLGWYTDSGNPVSTSDTVTYSTNLTLYAKWKANTNTPYTIELYKESLSGEYELYQTLTKYGTTDECVSFDTSSYEYSGFSLCHGRSALQGQILGNGSLVLKVYYDRNTYSVIYNINTTQFDSIAQTKMISTPSSHSAIYGTNITLPNLSESISGYTFAGWSVSKDSKHPDYLPSATYTMPYNDVCLYAVFSPDSHTPYTVTTYMENVKQQYNCISTKTQYGTTGSDITLKTPETPAGYYLNTKLTCTNGIILSDGSLQLQLVFDAVDYSIRYQSKQVPSSAIKEQTGIIGQKITLHNIPYEHKTLIQTGWTENEEEESIIGIKPMYLLGASYTFSAQDIILYPTWKNKAPINSVSPDGNTDISIPSSTCTPQPSPSDNANITQDTNTPSKQTYTSQTIVLQSFNSMKLSHEIITLGIGETFVLRSTGTSFATFTSSNKKVQLTSKKSDTSQQIKAKKKGTCVIFVTSADGTTKKCTIHIKKAPKKITVKKKTLSLKKGKTYKIKYSLSKNSACRTFKYKSSKKKVAKVSKTGIITCMKKGKCTITIATYNKRKAKIKLTVK